MPKVPKNAKPPKFKIGDKIFYETLKGQRLPGVVFNQAWNHDGSVYYHINVRGLYGENDYKESAIYANEEHLESPQMGLFAAKQPRFQIGDAVEYSGDTNDGVWVIIKAKYRPQKKMWIYWIRPRDYDGSDKYMPSQGMSVWEWDLYPTQRSLNIKEKPKFIELTDPKLAAKPKKKPIFQVGDSVYFKANPNISGTISKIKGDKWNWHYYVRYPHPSQGKMVEHAYGGESILPTQQDLEFRSPPKFEKGEWVNAEGRGGEIIGKRWSSEHSRWEYRIMNTSGSAYWYEENVIIPLDRPKQKQKCRCDGTPMGNSDHCPKCGCEEYEEQCGKQTALSKKQAGWLEKSRDMYRFEQKPIGKDRKQVLGPQPPKVKNTFLELPQKEGKRQPKYLQGDSVDIGMNAPGRVQSYFWSNEHQAFFYRILVGAPGEEHEIGLWEIQIHPSQQRLFAARNAPLYREGDIVRFRGNPTSGLYRVRSVYTGKEPMYKIDHLTDYSYEYVSESQIEPQQQQKGLFAMKVTAGEVLPFDPSKKKLKTGPGTGITEIPLTEGMQEDRDAIFYAFDNALIDLKELENNMLAIGESDIANNIAQALQVLKARF